MEIQEKAHPVRAKVPPERARALLGKAHIEEAQRENKASKVVNLGQDQDLQGNQSLSITQISK